MGMVVSLILIAFGAILTWAVNAHVNGINVTAVGVILMVVGIVSFVLSAIFWSSWFGPGYWGRQRAIPTGRAVPRRRFAYGAGGQAVVQDDVVEAGPPPAGPLP
jgi:hypothetical protein